jgi:hypothetical protein
MLINWYEHNHISFSIAVGPETPPEVAARLEKEDASIVGMTLDWAETAAEMAANCRRVADWLDRVPELWPSCVIETEID